MDFLGRAQTFVRILEAGSLSAAARSTRMSLAAVSRQVTSLEEELGARLFVRTTRTLRLTEEGQRFAAHAAQLVRDAEAARASVRPDGTLAGNVVVSASVTLGVQRIVPFVGKMLGAHPRLGIELRLEDRSVDLVGEGVDIAVRAGLALPDTTSLVARPLATFARVVVASPAYLRKHGTPKTVAALAKHGAIAGLASTVTWQFDEGAVTLAPRLRIGTLLGVLTAVREGLGIAVLPDFVVDRDLANGALKQILPTAQLAPVTAHALYRQEQRGVRRIEAVIAHLKETVPLDPSS